MVCEDCKKRPATVKVTQVINGQKSEYHLCEQCARERGSFSFGFDNKFSIHNLLAGILDLDQPGVGAYAPEVKCPACGLTFSEFSKIGRFGCARCYEAFGDKLPPLFRRIHGNIEHVGKVPHRRGGDLQIKKELQNYRQELAQAVAREEYERAATLRDKIRELEKRLTGGKTNG